MGNTSDEVRQELTSMARGPALSVTGARVISAASSTVELHAVDGPAPLQAAPELPRAENLRNVPRVLCLDDNPQVLAILARFLAPRFDVHAATDPREALRILERADAPFAVVVSDRQMPHMDGLTFLSRARRLAPNAGRVLLTGHADAACAIEAVNTGAVFRFLTKPCRPEALVGAVSAASEQFRLLESERVLLEQTVRGAVNALTEVLTVASPSAFARGMRLKGYVEILAQVRDIPDRWEIEVAALISQLGCVSFPPSLVERMHTGKPLTAAEQEMVDGLPAAAVAFIAQIPRLDSVRETLRHLNCRFDGAGSPSGSQVGKRIPLGARILRLVGDLDWLLASGMTLSLALGNLGARTGTYDPGLLTTFQKALLNGAEVGVRRIPFRHVQEGMVFAADVKGPRGLLLAARGQEVGPALINRLRYVWDTALLDAEVSVCNRTEYQEVNIEIAHSAGETSSTDL